MDNLIDRRDHFLHQIVATPKNIQNKKQGFSQSSPWLCIVNNGQVHEDWKIGRSSATPTKLFSVEFYDLKFMSFKFGNDIFISFEMP
jgi:hypothetical protein